MFSKSDTLPLDPFIFGNRERVRFKPGQTEQYLKYLKRVLLAPYFEEDYNRTYLDIHSRYIERFIKRCKSYATLTPNTVTAILNLIIYLHNYNEKVAKATSDYPWCPQFTSVLLQYISLECKILYTLKFYSAERERKIQNRILSLLMNIIGTYYRHKGIPTGKIVNESSKIILKLCVALRKNFDLKNDLLENITRKLLDKIGALQQMKKFKNRHLPTSDDHSKDMFKLIANEYNIDELFEGKDIVNIEHGFENNKSDIFKNSLNFSVTNSVVNDQVKESFGNSTYLNDINPQHYPSTSASTYNHISHHGFSTNPTNYQYRDFIGFSTISNDRNTRNFASLAPSSSFGAINVNTQNSNVSIQIYGKQNQSSIENVNSKRSQKKREFKLTMPKPITLKEEDQAAITEEIIISDDESDCSIKIENTEVITKEKLVDDTQMNQLPLDSFNQKSVNKQISANRTEDDLQPTESPNQSGPFERDKKQIVERENSQPVKSIDQRTVELICQRENEPIIQPTEEPDDLLNVESVEQQVKKSLIKQVDTADLKLMESLNQKQLNTAAIQPIIQQLVMPSDLQTADSLGQQGIEQPYQQGTEPDNQQLNETVEELRMPMKEPHFHKSVKPFDQLATESTSQQSVEVELQLVSIDRRRVEQSYQQATDPAISQFEESVEQPHKQTKEAFIQQSLEQLDPRSAESPLPQIVESVKQSDPQAKEPLNQQSLEELDQLATETPLHQIVEPVKLINQRTKEPLIHQSLEQLDPQSAESPLPQIVESVKKSDPQAKELLNQKSLKEVDHRATESPLQQLVEPVKPIDPVTKEPLIQQSVEQLDPRSAESPLPQIVESVEQTDPQGKEPLNQQSLKELDERATESPLQQIVEPVKTIDQRTKEPFIHQSLEQLDPQSAESPLPQIVESVEQTDPQAKEPLSQQSLKEVDHRETESSLQQLVKPVKPIDPRTKEPLNQQSLEELDQLATETPLQQIVEPVKPINQRTKEPLIHQSLEQLDPRSAESPLPQIVESVEQTDPQAKEPLSQQSLKELDERATESPLQQRVEPVKTIDQRTTEPLIHQSLKEVDHRAKESPLQLVEPVKPIDPRTKEPLIQQSLEQLDPQAKEPLNQLSLKELDERATESPLQQIVEPVKTIDQRTKEPLIHQSLEQLDPQWAESPLPQIVEAVKQSDPQAKEPLNQQSLEELDQLGTETPLQQIVEPVKPISQRTKEPLIHQSVEQLDPRSAESPLPQIVESVKQSDPQAKEPLNQQSLEELDQLGTETPLQQIVEPVKPISQRTKEPLIHQSVEQLDPRSAESPLPQIVESVKQSDPQAKEPLNQQSLEELDQLGTETPLQQIVEPVKPINQRTKEPLIHQSLEQLDPRSAESPLPQIVESVKQSDPQAKEPLNQQSLEELDQLGTETPLQQIVEPVKTIDQRTTEPLIHQSLEQLDPQSAESPLPQIVESVKQSDPQEKEPLNQQSLEKLDQLATETPLQQIVEPVKPINQRTKEPLIHQSLEQLDPRSAESPLPQIVESVKQSDPQAKEPLNQQSLEELDQLGTETPLQQIVEPVKPINQRTKEPLIHQSLEQLDPRSVESPLPQIVESVKQSDPEAKEPLNQQSLEELDQLGTETPLQQIVEPVKAISQRTKEPLIHQSVEQLDPRLAESPLPQIVESVKQSDPQAKEPLNQQSLKEVDLRATESPLQQLVEPVKPINQRTKEPLIHQSLEQLDPRSVESPLPQIVESVKQSDPEAKEPLNQQSLEELDQLGTETPLQQIVEPVKAISQRTKEQPLFHQSVEQLDPRLAESPLPQIVESVKQSDPQAKEPLNQQSLKEVDLRATESPLQQLVEPVKPIDPRMKEPLIQQSLEQLDPRSAESPLPQIVQSVKQSDPQAKEPLNQQSLKELDQENNSSTSKLQNQHIEVSVTAKKCKIHYETVSAQIFDKTIVECTNAITVNESRTRQNFNNNFVSDKKKKRKNINEKSKASNVLEKEKYGTLKNFQDLNILTKLLPLNMNKKLKKNCAALENFTENELNSGSSVTSEVFLQEEIHNEKQKGKARELMEIGRKLSVPEKSNTENYRENEITDIEEKSITSIEKKSLEASISIQQPKSNNLINSPSLLPKKLNDTVVSGKNSTTPQSTASIENQTTKFIQKPTKQFTAKYGVTELCNVIQKSDVHENVPSEQISSQVTEESESVSPFILQNALSDTGVHQKNESDLNIQMPLTDSNLESVKQNVLEKIATGNEEIEFDDKITKTELSFTKNKILGRLSSTVHIRESPICKQTQSQMEDAHQYLESNKKAGVTFKEEECLVSAISGVPLKGKETHNCNKAQYSQFPILRVLVTKELTHKLKENYLKRSMKKLSEKNMSTNDLLKNEKAKQGYCKTETNTSDQTQKTDDYCKVSHKIVSDKTNSNKPKDLLEAEKMTKKIKMPSKKVLASQDNKANLGQVSEICNKDEVSSRQSCGSKSDITKNLYQEPKHVKTTVEENVSNNIESSIQLISEVAHESLKTSKDKQDNDSVQVIVTESSASKEINQSCPKLMEYVTNETDITNLQSQKTKCLLEPEEQTLLMIKHNFREIIANKFDDFSGKKNIRRTYPPSKSALNPVTVNKNNEYVNQSRSKDKHKNDLLEDNYLNKEPACIKHYNEHNSLVDVNVEDKSSRSVNELTVQMSGLPKTSNNKADANLSELVKMEEFEPAETLPHQNSNFSLNENMYKNDNSSKKLEEIETNENLKSSNLKLNVQKLAERDLTVVTNKTSTSKSTKDISIVTNNLDEKTHKERKSGSQLILEYQYVKTDELKNYKTNSGIEYSGSVEPTVSILQVFDTPQEVEMDKSKPFSKIETESKIIGHTANKDKYMETVSGGKIQITDASGEKGSEPCIKTHKPSEIREKSETTREIDVISTKNSKSDVHNTLTDDPIQKYSELSKIPQNIDKPKAVAELIPKTYISENFIQKTDYSIQKTKESIKTHSDKSGSRTEDSVKNIELQKIPQSIEINILNENNTLSNLVSKETSNTHITTLANEKQLETLSKQPESRKDQHSNRKTDNKKYTHSRKSNKQLKKFLHKSVSVERLSDLKNIFELKQTSPTKDSINELIKDNIIQKDSIAPLDPLQQPLENNQKLGPPFVQSHESVIRNDSVYKNNKRDSKISDKLSNVDVQNFEDSTSKIIANKSVTKDSSESKLEQAEERYGPEKHTNTKEKYQLRSDKFNKEGKLSSTKIKKDQNLCDNRDLEKKQTIARSKENSYEKQNNEKATKVVRSEKSSDYSTVHNQKICEIKRTKASQKYFELTKNVPLLSGNKTLEENDPILLNVKSEETAKEISILEFDKKRTIKRQKELLCDEINERLSKKICTRIPVGLRDDLKNLYEDSSIKRITCKPHSEHENDVMSMFIVSDLNCHKEEIIVTSSIEESPLHMLASVSTEVGYKPNDFMVTNNITRSNDSYTYETHMVVSNEDYSDSECNKLIIAEEKVVEDKKGDLDDVPLSKRFANIRRSKKRTKHSKLVKGLNTDVSVKMTVENITPKKVRKECNVREEDSSSNSSMTQELHHTTGNENLNQTYSHKKLRRESCPQLTKENAIIETPLSSTNLNLDTFPKRKNTIASTTEKLKRNLAKDFSLLDNDVMEFSKKQLFLQKIVDQSSNSTQKKIQPLERKLSIQDEYLNTISSPEAFPSNRFYNSTKTEATMKNENKPKEKLSENVQRRSMRINKNSEQESQEEYQTNCNIIENTLKNSTNPTDETVYQFSPTSSNMRQNIQKYETSENKMVSFDIGCDPQISKIRSSNRTHGSQKRKRSPKTYLSMPKVDIKENYDSFNKSDSKKLETSHSIKDSVRNVETTQMSGVDIIQNVDNFGNSKSTKKSEKSKTNNELIQNIKSTEVKQRKTSKQTNKQSNIDLIQNVKSDTEVCKSGRITKVAIQENFDNLRKSESAKKLQRSRKTKGIIQNIKSLKTNKMSINDIKPKLENLEDSKSLKKLEESKSNKELVQNIECADIKPYISDTDPKPDLRQNVDNLEKFESTKKLDALHDNKEIVHSVGNKSLKSRRVSKVDIKENFVNLRKSESTKKIKLQRNEELGQNIKSVDFKSHNETPFDIRKKRAILGKYETPKKLEQAVNKELVENIETAKAKPCKSDSTLTQCQLKNINLKGNVELFQENMTSSIDVLPTLKDLKNMNPDLSTDISHLNSKNDKPGMLSDNFANIDENSKQPKNGKSDCSESQKTDVDFKPHKNETPSELDIKKNRAILRKFEAPNNLEQAQNKELVENIVIIKTKPSKSGTTRTQYQLENINLEGNGELFQEIMTSSKDVLPTLKDMKNKNSDLSTDISHLNSKNDNPGMLADNFANMEDENSQPPKDGKSDCSESQKTDVDFKPHKNEIPSELDIKKNRAILRKFEAPNNLEQAQNKELVENIEIIKAKPSKSGTTRTQYQLENINLEGNVELFQEIMTSSKDVLPTLKDMKNKNSDLSTDISHLNSKNDNPGMLADNFANMEDENSQQPKDGKSDCSESQKTDVDFKPHKNETPSELDIKKNRAVLRKFEAPNNLEQAQNKELIENIEIIKAKPSKSDTTRTQYQLENINLEGNVEIFQEIMTSSKDVLPTLKDMKNKNPDLSTDISHLNSKNDNPGMLSDNFANMEDENSQQPKDGKSECSKSQKMDVDLKPHKNETPFELDIKKNQSMLRKFEAPNNLEQAQHKELVESIETIRAKPCKSDTTRTQCQLKNINLKGNVELFQEDMTSSKDVLPTLKDMKNKNQNLPTDISHLNSKNDNPDMLPDNMEGENSQPKQGKNDYSESQKTIFEVQIVKASHEEKDIMLSHNEKTMCNVSATSESTISEKDNIPPKNEYNFINEKDKKTELLFQQPLKELELDFVETQNSSQADFKQSSVVELNKLGNKISQKVEDVLKPNQDTIGQKNDTTPNETTFCNDPLNLVSKAFLSNLLSIQNEKIKCDSKTEVQVDNMYPANDFDTSQNNGDIQYVSPSLQNEQKSLTIDNINLFQTTYIASEVDSLNTRKRMLVKHSDESITKQPKIDNVIDSAFLSNPVQLDPICILGKDIPDDVFENVSHSPQTIPVECVPEMSNEITLEKVPQTTFDNSTSNKEFFEEIFNDDKLSSGPASEILPTGFDNEIIIPDFPLAEDSSTISTKRNHFTEISKNSDHDYPKTEEIGVKDCYMHTGAAEVTPKHKIENPPSNETENLTSSNQSEASTDNQAESQSYSENCITSFPILSFSDIEAYDFLESFNTGGQNECPITYVNPKELVSTSVKTPENQLNSYPKKDNKEALEEQDVPKQLLTVEKQQEDIENNSLQNSLTTNANIVSNPPKTYPITVSDSPKVEQQQKPQQTYKTQESGKIWQHFINTKDDKAKVIVIPTHQNQMPSESDGSSYYSVIPANSSGMSSNSSRKHCIKTPLDNKATFAQHRTYSRTQIPTTQKEKSKKTSSQITNENGSKINIRDLLHLRKLRNNRPPESPSGAPHVSVTKDIAVVTWDPSRNSGSKNIEGYTVEYSIVGTNSWKEENCDRNSLTHVVKNLQPGQRYIFRIKAYNVYGRSEPSQESNEIELEEHEIKHPKKHQSQTASTAKSSHLTEKYAGIQKGSSSQLNYSIDNILSSSQKTVPAVAQVVNSQSNEISAEQLNYNEIFDKVRASDDNHFLQKKVTHDNRIKFEPIRKCSNDAKRAHGTPDNDMPKKTKRKSKTHKVARDLPVIEDNRRMETSPKHSTGSHSQSMSDHVLPTIPTDELLKTSPKIFPQKSTSNKKEKNQFEWHEKISKIWSKRN